MKSPRKRMRTRNKLNSLFSFLCCCCCCCCWFVAAGCVGETETQPIRMSFVISCQQMRKAFTCIHSHSSCDASFCYFWKETSKWAHLIYSNNSLYFFFLSHAHITHTQQDIKIYMCVATTSSHFHFGGRERSVSKKKVDEHVFG